MDDPTRRPATRFAPARGARLAYQVFGSGARTVVAVPPTAQNIELSWEYPAVRSMLDRFGGFCRYLHFDKRGTGCSDRQGRIADLDERVDDLRAIMDDAAVERAFLFGNSEGGPMSLLFAATYPERVDGVILFGSGARLLPADTTTAELEARRIGNRAYAAKWGTDESRTAPGMAPSLAALDPAFMPWHRRYERFAATQDALVELLELGMLADVSELLPTIDQPVLLLHRIDDPVIPIARARETCARLPNAELIELSGADHFAYAGDVEAWMAPFERFVTGTVSPQPPPRPRPVTSTPSASSGPDPDPVTCTLRVVRPQVRIEVLGRFAVVVDGHEVPIAAWGSRRARQLCKRLVLARGWPVTRDELFDLLWPDERNRDRLSARLSVQLSGVRRVLHGGIIATRESVRLDLDAVSTDLEAVFRAPDDHATLAAYTGPLLPEDTDELWTAASRTQVHNHVVLAGHRVLTAIDGGDTARDLEVVERLLTIDPFDERAHRERIRALDRAHRHAAAQQAYDEYEAAMMELGVDVEPLEAALAHRVDLRRGRRVRGTDSKPRPS